eukprot:4671331-Pleurochrysis_carterae.AAC.3
MSFTIAVVITKGCDGVLFCIVAKTLFFAFDCLDVYAIAAAMMFAVGLVICALFCSSILKVHVDGFMQVFLTLSMDERRPQSYLSGVIICTYAAPAKRLLSAARLCTLQSRYCLSDVAGLLSRRSEFLL